MSNPAEDIVLQPYDVISVGRAELVYMSGDVGKTGGIELGERDSITILQALIQAGGVTRDAKKDKVRILRPVLGTNRRFEIDVDVARVFEGKDLDVPLLPNDVVYVPHSYTRADLTDHRPSHFTDDSIRHFHCGSVSSRIPDLVMLHC